jgi:hypothetical protein
MRHCLPHSKNAPPVADANAGAAAMQGGVYAFTYSISSFFAPSISFKSIISQA